MIKKSLIFKTLILISTAKNYSYRSIILDFETLVGFIEKAVVVCLFIGTSYWLGKIRIILYSPVGKVAGRQSGRSARWPVGKVAGRQGGRSARWPVGKVAGRQGGRSARWPVGKVAGHAFNDTYPVYPYSPIIS